MIVWTIRSLVFILVVGLAALAAPRATVGDDLKAVGGVLDRMLAGVAQQHDAAGRAELRHPHGTRAAEAELFPLGAADESPVSLGLLCRPADRDAVLASLPAGGVSWMRDEARSSKRSTNRAFAWTRTCTASRSASGG